MRAHPDQALWALFTRDDAGWTGGDGTYSVPLPDGRTVWLFSDSFLGPLLSDRSRPRSVPFIHNAFVVQEGERLITLHGGTARTPRALFGPSDGSSWYWVYDGTVAGDRLHVFLLKFLRHGPGMFDWHWTGTDLATLRLPELTLETISPVPASTGVHYGAALLEEGEFTYVYGVEDLAYAKYGHLARAGCGGLRGPWEFFDGAGWSPSPRRSARILDASIGNEFSVSKRGDGYVLVTMDTGGPLREWREIVAYFAAEPAGPWSGRTLLHVAPEPDDEGWFAYNAHAHPQLADDDELLVSYNVNSLRLDDLYADADLYRARFVRVALPRPKGTPPT